MLSKANYAELINTRVIQNSREVHDSDCDPSSGCTCLRLIKCQQDSFLTALLVLRGHVPLDTLRAVCRKHEDLLTEVMNDMLFEEKCHIGFFDDTGGPDKTKPVTKRKKKNKRKKTGARESVSFQRMPSEAVRIHGKQMKEVSDMYTALLDDVGFFRAA